MTRPRGIALAAGILVAVLAPADASAQWAVGVDVSDVKSDTRFDGGAIDVRFGGRFGLPRAAIWHSLIMQPEVVGGYARLPRWTDDRQVGRLGGGGRLGLLLDWFEPFFLFHVSVADDAGRWGPLYDIGGAADFRFATWSLGVHWIHDWFYAPRDHFELDVIGLHAEVRGYWF